MFRHHFRRVLGKLPGQGQSLEPGRIQNIDQ